jgi:hypothetical protein
MHLSSLAAPVRRAIGSCEASVTACPLIGIAALLNQPPQRSFFMTTADTGQEGHDKSSGNNDWWNKPVFHAHLRYRVSSWTTVRCVTD